MSDESITQITLQKIEAEIVKRERERAVKMVRMAFVNHPTLDRRVLESACIRLIQSGKEAGNG